MIIRLVQMTFKQENVIKFKSIFEDKKEHIRAFHGCQYLELLQGQDTKGNVFYTYSHWDSQEDLDNYRHSHLFAETWKETKALFSEKAQAISLDRLHKLA